MDVHQNEAAVFTSYAWLRALLLDTTGQVSYSEIGAKGNPWIESFWARFKQENRSLLLEAETLSPLLPAAAHLSRIGGNRRLTLHSIVPQVGQTFERILRPRSGPADEPP